MMTSIDDLFKKPNLPFSSNKRKLEVPDAEAAYKSTKLSRSSSPNGHASASNDQNGDEDDDDIEAGPALPPDDDAGDDDEGRFFGTGMTASASEALDYLDGVDGNGSGPNANGGAEGRAGGGGQEQAEEKIDSAWLRRLTTSFSKKVTKNAELRARFESEPTKFMASEADLDAEIKSFSSLAEHPELYTEFSEDSPAVASLVGLLAHENTDVAIGVLEILAELLDEDVPAEEGQWEALARALLEADLLELLKSNLERLDEVGEESDRGGVYHTLAVMESLASQGEMAERVGGTELLLWLCERIKVPEEPLGQNKQYAAEVLQVLLQTSSALRRRLAGELDGVDLLLQLLFLYRKGESVKDSHEEEYVENVFDALTCVVDESEGKKKFVEAEGVELMLMMLKVANKNTTHRVLRVLDHALGGQGGPAAAACCEKLVDAAGLKPIFGVFMKKSSNAAIEHLLDIFAALLRLLPGESAARIRTLAKFTEKDGEKVKKLTELRDEFARRIAIVDKEIRLEQKTLPDDEIEERADEWFSRRLDGGLYCLQTIDVILSWLIAEDPKMKTKVSTLLDGGGGLKAIKASLEEQKNELDTGVAADEDTRDMLETLISFLN